MKQKTLDQKVELLMQQVKDLEKIRASANKKKTVFTAIFSKRHILLGIMGMILITGTIVYAAVPNIFTSGSPAVASQVNENFDYLLARTVPSGIISAFNGSTCPTGWISSDGLNGTPDFRGRFIRGYDDGAGNDPGRVVGTYQADAFQGHGHRFNGSKNIALIYCVKS